MKQENVLESVLLSSQGVSVSQILMLLMVGLVPVAMMSMTSYLKVSIILAVLRNALGGGQIPSQAISGILALVITFFTMAPVLESCMSTFSACQTRADGKSSFEHSLLSIRAGIEPLLGFLKQNTSMEERIFFFRLDERRSFNKKKLPESVDEESDTGDTINGHNAQNSVCGEMEAESLLSCLDTHERISSLVLSFVMSELRTACTMGVYLFLPFLVIDLLISTILTGLGMMMVSPVTISLPVKLLLFVVTDGWKLLTESLISGYIIPI
jgi:type III secretion protein R